MSNWLAFGTGVGIELASNGLRVVVARVRPSSVEVPGAHLIENHHERPAAEWGREYAEFLSRHGAAHLAATVILPRRDVIVRVVALPGVESKDTEAALRLQIDTMHPYAEGDAAWSWARIGKTNSILVALARQSYIDRQLELLTEAGVKVASFTVSAAAVYGALRLHGAPPAEGFAGLLETEAGVEVYGESAARPVYSASVPDSWERAALVARSELRLERLEPRELTEVLPKPVAAPDNLSSTFGTAYAAALASACPRYALSANLLPQSMRQQSSRLIYAPTLALGALLMAGLAGLGFYSRYEDKRYLEALHNEIQTLEPRVKRLEQVDKRMEQTRQRMRTLDAFQARTRNDLDAVKEVTRVVPPPAWLNTMELTRTTLTIAGESDQATGLLKSIDSSAQFQNSEFVVPLNRVGNTEIFRIRAAREGGPR